MTQWQTHYRDRLIKLENEELFDEMLETNVPDDYNGMFTPMGAWYAREAERQVRLRLHLWLEDFEILEVADLLVEFADVAYREKFCSAAEEFADRIHMAYDMRRKEEKR